MSRCKSLPLPRFETKRASDYKVVHATGALGVLNPGEGSLIFFVDRVIPKTNPDGSMTIDMIERELLIEIKMSPVQFKALTMFMMNRIKEYENRFGEIPLPSQQKGKKDIEKFFHT